MGIILAIDCGTTSTRVIAFNDTYQVEHMEQSELPLQHPDPDWVEQDAILMWNQTKKCLDATISSIGAKNIQSIGITNQRETSIAWQKSTGLALGSAINWQCRRTASRCAELSAHTELIKQKTGLPLDAYFSASKFEWHINNTPNVQHLLNHQDLCFGTVDAWILYKENPMPRISPMPHEPCYLIFPPSHTMLNCAIYLVFQQPRYQRFNRALATLGTM